MKIPIQFDIQPGWIPVIKVSRPPKRYGGRASEIACKRKLIVDAKGHVCSKNSSQPPSL
jgi:hypothetical protein